MVSSFFPELHDTDIQKEIKGTATHSFSFVEVSHTYVALVMAAEVDEVDGGTHPEVEAWQPHKDSVLEALGEVRVRSVPCTVPILVEGKDRRGNINKKDHHICFVIPISTLTWLSGYK